MDEKKMTLEDLVDWLDDNDVSYEIDDTGRLAVKDSLMENLRTWVKDHGYTSLPDELFHVNGSLWLEQTSIVSLGGLTSVGGDLNLWNTSITSLGNLTSVGGFLNLRNTPLASLGNLTSAGGWLNLRGVPITSLGNLTSVGGYLDLEGAPITSLGNLTSVGGDIDLKGTSITSLDNLTFVGWNLILEGAPITSLGNLPQVGEHLYLDRDQFQLLTKEALQKVKGKIRYWGQAIKKWIDLSPPELEAILAENEQRESLNNTRESDVDWDLYDR